VDDSSGIVEELESFNNLHQHIQLEMRMGIVQQKFMMDERSIKFKSRLLPHIRWIIVHDCLHLKGESVRTEIGKDNKCVQVHSMCKAHLENAITKLNI